MKYSIPETMKAVRQHQKEGKLLIDEVPVPKPGKGEVLVKMEYAPINPSDLSFLNGSYANKPVYPVVPGIEGSGTVVASGGGLLANLRKGKRVTCSSTPGKGGTWAEYMLTSAMRVIPLAKHISFEQGAMLIVNPMTVLGFMEIIKTEKHKAVINNAAASSLGRMMRNICNSNGIELINIVRKEEHVQKLKSEGVKYVLNSEDKNFREELIALNKQINASLCLNAVGGEQTATLVKALPPGGKLILYSNLSQQAMTIEPRDIIQKDIRIEGFFLGTWTSKRSILYALKAAKQVQKLVSRELKSDIREIYELGRAQNALDDYLKNMSNGKILIKLS